ncbi:MAG TPA: hypothetical protein PKB06_04340 [Actinotalea sp.]|nr:hypothetical protein [Actinotalea sp.]
MSIWDILQALVHRWYVVVAIGVVAAGVAYAAVSAGGVYWSRVEVTFIAPSSTVNPNSLAVTSSDLVITAGVVAKRINGNADRPVMADAATTLVGEGMLDGWAVRLPDYGGQWSTVYSRQVLDVHRGAEHVGGEGLDVAARDPGRAEPGGDVGRFELVGQHPLERPDVHAEAIVGGHAGPGGLQLLAHVAGQVLRRRHEPPAAGFVAHELTEALPAGGRADADQLLGSFQGDLSGLVGEVNRSSRQRQRRRRRRLNSPTRHERFIVPLASGGCRGCIGG